MQDMQQQQGYMPPPPPKQRSSWIERGVVLALLVVTFGLGAVAGENGANPAPAVAAAATVSVPQACLDAAHAGQEAMDLASQGFTLAADGLTAIANLDFAEVDRITAEMHPLVAPMTAARNELDSATAECEAAAS